MLILQLIGEVIVYVFVELIFKGVIFSIIKFLDKWVTIIWRRITGKPLPKDCAELRTENLEKQLLCKNIELTVYINSVLTKGSFGIILEIIDNNAVFAEFYDNKGNHIESGSETVFRVYRNQYKLIE